MRERKSGREREGGRNCVCVCVCVYVCMLVCVYVCGASNMRLPGTFYVQIYTHTQRTDLHLDDAEKGFRFSVPVFIFFFWEGGCGTRKGSSSMHT